jgi:Domain of unknown function (DUF1929)/Bacterial Ig domain/Divergent InlB B-repeat domain
MSAYKRTIETYRKYIATSLFARPPATKAVQPGKKSSYAGEGFLLGILLMLMPALAFATVLIGNTNVGTVDAGDSNYINGSKVTTGATSVHVTSMSVFVGPVDTAPNDQFQLALYADLNGSPGALFANSTVGVLTPNTWNTLLLSATLQPNTSYWLVFNTNGRTSSVNNMHYDVGSPGDGVYSTNPVAFGNWPTVFGAATRTNSKYTLYATAESLADPIAPNITITAPQQNAQVSAIVNVSANATDNVAVAQVEFQLDGQIIGSAVTTPPYSVSWTTTLAPNGTHTLTAIASDTAGNRATSNPVVVTVFNANPRSQTGEWSPVMTWPLVAIHANLLKTGKVLVWDEEDTTTHPMLWDPVTQSLTGTGAVGNELWCSGHAHLADGKLFVAGGHQPHVGEVGIKATYIYNPDGNTWSRSGDMAFQRWYPALTRLSDGSVAIFSGQITTGIFADTPEIYNPSSAIFRPLTTIATPELHEEEYPAHFYLPNGKVLAISPEHGGVQLFDPVAVTWTRLNSTPITLGSAVQYRPGKVLMSGGGATFLSSANGKTAVMDTNVTPLTWRSTASMSVGRYMHNLVMLPTGKVLAVGGAGALDQQIVTPGPLSPELWDPNTETWATLAAMAVPRMYHSIAILLPDGRVLAAGGGRNGNSVNQLSAQLYSPPYLFKGTRPTIMAAPDSVQYGGAFAVNSPEAAAITIVSLVGLGSVTHGTDMNQTYTELPFTKSTGQLSVSAPRDAKQISPGYYMLFLVDANGVPSAAKILKIASTTPTPLLHSLSVTKSGSGSGSVASTTIIPTGQPAIACGTTCTASYTDGTAVTLSAVPNPGSVFAGWSGAADCSDGSVTMTTAITCNAAFNLQPTSSTTLGLTSIGSIPDSGDSNHLNGSKVFSPNGGGVAKMSVYVGNIDTATNRRQYQFAIYTDNAGRPGTLVAKSTSSGTLRANAWNTLAITATLQPNTNYWLLYNTNGGATSVNNMYFNDRSTGQGAFSTSNVTFGTWPLIFPGVTLTSAEYSLYATLGQ